MTDRTERGEDTTAQPAPPFTVVGDNAPVCIDGICTIPASGADSGGADSGGGDSGGGDARDGD